MLVIAAYGFAWHMEGLRDVVDRARTSLDDEQGNNIGKGEKLARPTSPPSPRFHAHSLPLKDSTRISALQHDNLRRDATSNPLLAIEYMILAQEMLYIFRNVLLG